MHRDRLLPAALCLLFTWVTACSDDPSSPRGLPGEVQAAAGPAASLTITPGAVELVPNEEITFEVTAVDDAGAVIQNPRPDWTSLDPTVADFVTMGDRNQGRLTALAEDGGTARIVAELDGAADTAIVTVATLAQRLFIVDSTQLNLVSEPSDLAQGRFVFEVIAMPGGLDALTMGEVQYIAGDQGATFFRKAVSVELSGGVLTVETEDAELREVFPRGARAEGRVPVRFGPGGRAATECDGGRGIKCVEPPGPGGPPGLAAQELGDLFGFPSGFNLCASPSAIEGATVCVNGRAELEGSVDVDAGLDIGVSVVPPEFRLIAEGGVDFEVVYLLALSASAGYLIEKEIVITSKPVTILGIPGKIKLLVVPGLSGFVGGAFELTGRVAGGASVKAGAICDSDGCSEVLEASRTLTVEPPIFRAREGSAEARLFVVARLKLEWAGNEPQVDIGPFFALSGDASEFDHVVHNGQTLFPRLHAGLDFGVQAGLAYAIKAFGTTFATFSLTADIIRIDLIDWWGQGELAVANSTTGIDLDPDGYSLRVFRRAPNDAPVWATSLMGSIATNGDAVFVPPGGPCLQFIGGSPSNCHLVGTHHSIEMSGAMWNCTVQDVQPAHAHLHPFGRIGATIAVECISVLEAMANTIDEMLAAGLIDDAEVAQSLKDKLAAADEARLSGRPRPANNMLDSFISHVEAQTNTGSDPTTGSGSPRPTAGKHVHPDAAALLIERATLVQESYLTSITMR